MSVTPVQPRRGGVWGGGGVGVDCLRRAAVVGMDFRRAAVVGVDFRRAAEALVGWVGY